ncbi:hypothetical protein BDP27DRAFT_1367148 [Rhodocollybia butyracea]|uniref:Uncharacterized protein n=1 Tax=Rhodocollybia butyracea TaxID=206335 RepID=A0A9P5PJF4_9AGAR|nr:hypothetical protein BDP27DRAFT_1367148 [Rhodocollybia butyracea]
MFFRFFALFFLFTSFGASIAASVPSATSIEISKRQDSSALDIFNTLQSSTDTILPQIAALAQAGNATEANVTPLVSNLRTAIQAATSSLSSSAPSSDDDAANLAVEIYTDIVSTISTLPGTIITDLAALIGDIDGGLTGVITVVQDGNSDLVLILQIATSAINFVASLIP